jgi:hypothetical protein
MKYLPIAASLALNVWLALLMSLQGAAGPAAATPSGASDTLRLDATRPRQPEALYAELVAQGLDKEWTKPIILRDVLATTNAGRSEAYWMSTPSDDYDRALDELEGRDRARALIEQIYGSAAKLDPAFEELYAPLGERFAFLSTDEQIATQKLQLRFARAAATGERELTASGALATRSPYAWQSTYERFMAELTELLGPEQAFEYELRKSPLATELRSAGTSLTEAEFRHAFTLLRSLREADPEHYVELRRQLRDVLGAQAFTRLWAARDPRFATIQTICRQNGLSPEDVMAAYEVLNDGQDTLLETLGATSPDAVGRTRTIEELKALEHRRLAEIVGPDVASRIVRSLALNAARAPAARRRL